MATILVTAGPTREPIDPVRFLSNESSGRMGFAIAAAAQAAGHEVILIAGPVHLPTPAGVRRIDVVTAREMLAALKQHFSACDALYMAAAVADWRPKRVLSGKWRAKDGGTQTTSLELVRNPDLKFSKLKIAHPHSHVKSLKFCPMHKMGHLQRSSPTHWVFLYLRSINTCAVFTAS